MFVFSTDLILQSNKQIRLLLRSLESLGGTQLRCRFGRVYTHVAGVGVCIHVLQVQGGVYTRVAGVGRGVHTCCRCRGVYSHVAGVGVCTHVSQVQECVHTCCRCREGCTHMLQV